MCLAEFRLQIVVIQLSFEVTLSWVSFNSSYVIIMHLFDSFNVDNSSHRVRNLEDYVVNRVRHSEPRGGRADSVSEYVEDIRRLGCPSFVKPEVGPTLGLVCQSVLTQQVKL